MTPRTLLPGDRATAIGLAEAVHRADAGIVSRTLLQTPELRVVVFTLAEGQELTVHTSARRAVIQVIDGAGEFFFDGRWERLAAGVVLHLPPRHPHAVRAAAGAFSMLLTLSAEPGGEVG
jgi:quercetin dioxygenase-like cupin family protein